MNIPEKDKDDQYITSIKRKALLGLSSMLILVWILIFAPGWTIVYWEGWGFFFSFSIPVIIISLYFLKHDLKLIEVRIKAGPTAEKEKSQQIIQSLTGVFFVLLLLFPGLDHRYHWSTMPWFLVVFGDFLVITGLFITYLVFRENSHTSAIIEVDQGQRVVQTGPYALIRHPMYSGGLLMLLGVPFALGSWWALIFTLLLFLAIVWRLLDEERFLSSNLQGYVQYCKKVRFRLIPFLW